MTNKSRTQKSVINAYTALMYNLLTILLGFVSRKIFLDTLGADVLGLNTTASSLLGFLNLAELGVGGAVAFTLYKPLASDDSDVVKEIVAVQGWLYRRIAYIIIGGSVILFALFPWIFDKIELPMWYAYGSFCVLLFSSLLSYFVNYKQVVLSASQQQYKINNSVQGFKIAKTIVQILGLYYLPFGYIYWLVIEFLAAICTSVSLNRTIYKNFPYLKSENVFTKDLLKKYEIIIVKIKQIFFHNIGGYVLTQTSPIIIYSYLSLTTVAMYGNYMLLISGITMLSTALNNGISAGIGNMVASESIQRVFSFYKELNSLRFLMASILSLSLLLLSTSFISIWFGAEFVIDNVSLCLLVANAFIALSRVNDPFLSAYGLFGDIWAPVVEAILNLGLSILLGHFFGLPGILSGILISLLIVVCCWKPYFLFSRGFDKPIYGYIRIFVKNMVLVALCWGISITIFRYVFSEPTTILGWFIEAIKVFSVIVFINCAIFQLFSCDFRLFTNRMSKIIKK